MRERPTWDIRDSDGRREIRLSGDWTLLTTAKASKRLRKQLESLTAKSNDIWNVEGIEDLDTAGAALLLWQIWGGRTPQHLACRDDQRATFNHLQRLSIPD